jgi:hypothetical protein
MVESASAVRSTATRSQESQAAPRRHRSPQQAPEPAPAGQATSSLQRLQAMVASSPRVAQLKKGGGWFNPETPLAREIRQLEAQLASLPEPEKRSREQQHQAETLESDIAWRKKMNAWGNEGSMPQDS